MLELEILLKQSQENLYDVIINLEKMFFIRIIIFSGPPFFIEALKVMFSTACLTTVNSELMDSE